MSKSRYRNVEQINELKSPLYFGSSDFPVQEDLDKIPTFKIRVARFDRLDQLASKYLGDGTYWWILAVVNNIDWMYSFDEGQILKIPINVDDVLRLI